MVPPAKQEAKPISRSGPMIPAAAAVGRVGIGSMLLRLMAAVTRNANDAILIAEVTPGAPPGPRIAFVNRALESMTGYSAAQLVGKDVRLLYRRGDRRQRQRLEDAIAAKRPVTVELQDRRKDGTPYTFELSLFPIGKADGRVAYWAFLHRDLSERKRREAEALRLQKTFTFAVSKAANRPGALASLLGEICRTGGWGYGQAWLPTSDGTALERGPRWPRPEGSDPHATPPDAGARLAPDDGLACRVWRTKRIEWVEG
ncbi:MAG: PAS domain-containing protein, partial [Planctomycetota bacterium]